MAAVSRWEVHRRTDRVADLSRAGASAARIARQLGVSVRTVHRYRARHRRRQ